MTKPFSPVIMILFFPVWLLTLVACKDSGPQPSDMVGHYKVSGRLKDGTVNKKAIKDSIDTAMEKAEKEMKNAKKELAREMDTSSIDTTTTEGKIEYAAKQMGKSLSELDVNFGDLFKDMGGMVSDLTTNGLGMAESLIKNLNISVELQADGDIKASGSLIDMAVRNAKWEVKDNKFLLYKNDEKEPDTFVIKDKTSQGFTLEIDKFLIDFVREDK